MKAHNLDKLPFDAQALIEYFTTMPTFFMPIPDYMVEVRLDDPVNHLIYGNSPDVLHSHSGNGSREYAHHYDDENWAVVHIEDEDWAALDHEALAKRAEEIIEELKQKAMRGEE